MLGLAEDMYTFEDFERDLHNGLNHLYDPVYGPASSLMTRLECDPGAGVTALRRIITHGIDELKPAPDVPEDTRARRIHELLHQRYVRNLTQDDAAERLGITPRHLRREQREAVRLLGRLLWEKGQEGARGAAPETPDEGHQAAVTAATDAEAVEWRTQVRREIDALQKGAPGAVADVSEAIHSAVGLASALTARHSVSLVVGQLPSGLLAAIHPSALRQILVTAIAELVRGMISGRIALRAGGTRDHVSIAITGSPARLAAESNHYVIRELLSTLGGLFELHEEDDSVSFVVSLPSAGTITVLVVEDNEDLVHFYKRYTAATRYRIVHLAQGQHVLETAAATPPHVIVLDIMMPDIDGWELLSNLHQHPRTRAIPVIVCSVIREEELALALGAAVFVAKPVRRQQFVGALDQVISRAASGAPGSAESSGAAY